MTLPAKSNFVIIGVLNLVKRDRMINMNLTPKQFYLLTSKCVGLLPKKAIFLNSSNFFIYKDKFINNLCKKGKKEVALRVYHDLGFILKSFNVFSDYFLLHALAKATPAVGLRKIRLNRNNSKTLVHVLGEKRRISVGVRAFLGYLRKSKKGSTATSLYNLVWQTVYGISGPLKTLHDFNLDIRRLLQEGGVFKGKWSRKKHYLRFFKPESRRIF